MAEVFPQIDPEVGQVELVSWNDEGYFLLNESFALERSHGGSDIHNWTICQRSELIQPLSQRTKLRGFPFMVYGQQDGTVLRLQFVQLKLVLKVVWQLCRADPDSDGSLNTQCIAKVVLNLFLKAHAMPTFI